MEALICHFTFGPGGPLDPGLPGSPVPPCTLQSYHVMPANSSPDHHLLFHQEVQVVHQFPGYLVDLEVPLNP